MTRRQASTFSNYSPAALGKSTAIVLFVQEQYVSNTSVSHTSAAQAAWLEKCRALSVAVAIVGMVISARAALLVVRSWTEAIASEKIM